jgi:predicted metalloprotease with PDZ domain
MLDLQIRKDTSEKKSLDDVMRKVYEDTYVREGRGYTEEEFQAAAVAVGGSAVGPIFDSRVKGREEVDFDRYLGYAGLRLEPKESPDREKGFLGVRLGGEGGRSIVKTRLAGSPAESMGLAVNDEVIGVDGLRLGPDRLSFYVANRGPGAEVRLTMARNGVIGELRGSLARRPSFEFRIATLKDPTAGQKAVFRGWLGEDWRPELKYPEYQRSPDRRQVLDFV